MLKLFLLSPWDKQQDNNGTFNFSYSPLPLATSDCRWCAASGLLRSSWPRGRWCPRPNEDSASVALWRCGCVLETTQCAWQLIQAARLPGGLPLRNTESDSRSRPSCTRLVVRWQTVGVASLFSVWYLAGADPFDWPDLWPPPTRAVSCRKRLKRRCKKLTGWFALSDKHCS